MSEKQKQPEFKYGDRIRVLRGRDKGKLGKYCQQKDVHGMMVHAVILDEKIKQNTWSYFSNGDLELVKP